MSGRSCATEWIDSIMALSNYGSGGRFNPGFDFSFGVAWVAVDLESVVDHLAAEIVHLVFEHVHRSAEMFVGTVTRGEDGERLAVQPNTV